MATHSSILAWKISWMEEPGRLQSMGRKESDTTEQLRFCFCFVAESVELKNFLKVNKETEKVGLKLNIQKTKIMAPGLITSWQVDGETVETVTEFIIFFGGGGSKFTADGNFSHEIKRHLVLGRKVMTNLDSILKSRDITLPTKVHLVRP